MHIPRQVIWTAWLLLLWAWTGVGALAENVQFFQVNLTDRSVSFALAEHPAISYSNNQLHITTESQSVDFNVPDIIDYRFTTTETAIRDLRLTQSQMHEGLLCISGLPTSSMVELYASNGRRILNMKASSSGMAVIDLGQLPKGVYIVSTASQSFKVTNK